MILWVSNVDTDMLALRVAVEMLPAGMPPVRGVPASEPSHIAQQLSQVSLVVIRLLGGSKSWSHGLDDLRSYCAAHEVPLLVFGGEAAHDTDLENLSTVPAPATGTAFEYLLAGGPVNVANMLKFLCTDLLGMAAAADPPEFLPTAGYMDMRHAACGHGPPAWRSGGVPRQDATYGETLDAAQGDPMRPKVGVIAYRAQVIAGNVSYVSELCSALERYGAVPVPVYTYSLRSYGDSSGSSSVSDRVPGGVLGSGSGSDVSFHVGEMETGAIPSQGDQDDRLGPVSPPSLLGLVDRTDHADATDHADVTSLLGNASVDAVIVTTMSSGSYDHDKESFDAYPLCQLDVPVLQGICSIASRRRFEDSNLGLSPVDVAMSVAMPEVDGRVITVPFSFKETVDDDELIGTGITAYRCIPDRVDRVASIATRMARLARTPVASKRVAIVLSAYPTSKSRLGNAVGLDTPRSVIDLLHAMDVAGYSITSIPSSGDELMCQLADGLIYEDYREYAPLGTGYGYDTEHYAGFAHQAGGAYRGSDGGRTGVKSRAAESTSEGMYRYKPDGIEPDGSDILHDGSTGWKMESATYRRVFDRLDERLKHRMIEQWGYPDANDGCYRFCGLDLGNVIVAVQPPRGYGDNPVVIYHSPDLPPTHHYMAFYRWLDEEWGADSIVHLGKHGTLEWLPGKGVGLSAGCAPDAVLGSMPMVYPFVVNDPGEGVQAKRRSHAVIIDHLVPPLTEAGSYGAVARLETLLDDHARACTLDPAKLPAIREQIAEIIIGENIHRDLCIDADDISNDNPNSLDSLLPAVDGYLCELKDAQIRGGLHVLGQAPAGDTEIDMIMAMTRLSQGDVPSLRNTVARLLGHPSSLQAGHGETQVGEVQVGEVQVGEVQVGEVQVGEVQVGEVQSGRTLSRAAIDEVDAQIRRLLSVLQSTGWNFHDALHRYREDTLQGMDAESKDAAAAVVLAEELSRPEENQLNITVQWICNKLIPRLHATSSEIGSILRALDGKFVMPGPSGAPSRGMANVLPTGRNFYSSDPRAIPSSLAWETGRQLAERLVERYVHDEGRYPVSVGIVVWGTATMRTLGDDIAQALALIGVRPCWETESGRVTALEVIPLEELGRPRVDVVLRISGLFRDAFANVIALFDTAVAMVAAMDEPLDLNPLRASGLDDPRVFGPKPGAYGSGVLDLMETGKWEDSASLAAMYMERSSYSYAIRERSNAIGRVAETGSIAGMPVARLGEWWSNDLDAQFSKDALKRRIAAIDVASKNQDNREHDIFDSDDYMQDHGGLIAAIRELAGREPRAYFGDSSDPAAPKVRSLEQEAARVLRSRVVNPKWIEAMKRHGYKGAFEMAATVDYMFGYDATAHIVDGWMYEKLTEAYVASDDVREFFAQSNPWALRAIVERLLDAAQRGMWEPSERAIVALRTAMLESEGWEEDRSIQK